VDISISIKAECILYHSLASEVCTEWSYLWFILEVRNPIQLRTCGDYKYSIFTPHIMPVNLVGFPSLCGLNHHVSLRH